MRSKFFGRKKRRRPKIVNPFFLFYFFVFFFGWLCSWVAAAVAEVLCWVCKPVQCSAAQIDKEGRGRVTGERGKRANRYKWVKKDLKK